MPAFGDASCLASGPHYYMMGKPPPPYQTPESDIIVSTTQELEVNITTTCIICLTAATFNTVQVQANETAEMLGEWLLTNNQWAVALKEMKEVPADACVVTFVSQV